MKVHKNRKGNHIIPGKTALTGGLAVFLISGLTGCDGDIKNDCKDPYAPQYKIEECKKRGYVGSSSHTSFLPFFFNSGSSNNYVGSTTSGSNKSIDTSNTSSTKSSGFFSGLSSSHSTGSSGSSGHSSFGGWPDLLSYL